MKNSKHEDDEKADSPRSWSDIDPDFEDETYEKVEDDEASPETTIAIQPDADLEISSPKTQSDEMQFNNKDEWLAIGRTLNAENSREWVAIGRWLSKGRRLFDKVEKKKAGARLNPKTGKFKGGARAISPVKTDDKAQFAVACTVLKSLGDRVLRDYRYVYESTEEAMLLAGDRPFAFYKAIAKNAEGDAGAVA